MAKPKQVEVLPKPKCSVCGSSQTYFRLKTLERVCTTCGAVVKA